MRTSTPVPSQLLHFRGQDTRIYCIETLKHQLKPNQRAAERAKTLVTRCTKRIFSRGQAKSPVTDRPRCGVPPRLSQWYIPVLLELLCSKNGVVRGANTTRLGAEHDLKVCAKTLRKVLSIGGTKHILPRLPDDESCPRCLGA